MHCVGQEESQDFKDRKPEAHPMDFGLSFLGDSSHLHTSPSFSWFVAVDRGLHSLSFHKSHYLSYRLPPASKRLLHMAFQTLRMGKLARTGQPH